MASIILQVNGSAVGSVTITTNLDQTNGDRLMNYLASTYGKKVTAGVVTQRTPQEMVQCYWDDIVKYTARQVEANEKTAASLAAQAAVPPFVTN